MIEMLQIDLTGGNKYEPVTVNSTLVEDVSYMTISFYTSEVKFRGLEIELCEGMWKTDTSKSFKILFSLGLECISDIFILFLFHTNKNYDNPIIILIFINVIGVYISGATVMSCFLRLLM